MDVYFLDNDFKIVNIVDDFSSLIWRRKYKTCGDYEIHCTHDRFHDIVSAAYVYRPDRSEVGLIESYSLNAPTCYAKGRFIECLLADKVIYPTEKYSGKTHEYIVRDLITKYMPNVVLCAANNPEIGYEINTQVTGKNLMEYVYDQLSSVDASFSLTCNLTSGVLSCSVIKPTDRFAPVIFSQEFDNLKTFGYQYSEKDVKNYAVIAGAGEGINRKFTYVDLSAGERRRDIFVDARDIQQDEGETEEKYLERLRQRGKEKLSTYKTVESCECTVDTTSNLEYMIDFDLGDICTIKDDRHGIICRKRISECEEVYENGSFSLSIVFGDSFLLLPQYLERKLT